MAASSSTPVIVACDTEDVMINSSHTQVRLIHVQGSRSVFVCTEDCIKGNPD